MQPKVIGAAARAGNVIEAVLAKLLPGRDAPGNRVPRIITHRSVGDGARLSVRGRIVRSGALRSNDEGIRSMRSASQQLVDVYRAFDVLEAPYVTVQVSLNGVTATAQTDDAGFFAVDLTANSSTGWTSGWHQPRICITAGASGSNIIADSETGSVSAVTGDVFVPPANATLVVVSDLDDTAMDTQSTRSIEMVRKVIFSSAEKRSPVPGVPELYRSLQRGRDGAGNNPICYISSGAWNLYDHVIDYLDLHELPKGAVYLNDWGSRSRSFHTVGHDHKADHVNQLLSQFTSLPFLLVGDDVHEDPELYTGTAGEYQQRIAAIWIRVVANNPRRLEEIERLRPMLRSYGTDLVVSADSRMFAADARQRGWIA